MIFLSTDICFFFKIIICVKIGVIILKQKCFPVLHVHLSSLACTQEIWRAPKKVELYMGFASSTSELVSLVLFIPLRASITR